MRGRLAAVFACAFLASACSALVAGKLGDTPPGRDGGLPTDCMEASDCDDMDPCNGAEACTGMRCVAGTPMLDGAGCGDMPRSICITGACRVSMCGDMVTDPMADPPEVCDDGDADDDNGCTTDCQFSCTDPADCDNEFDCDGAERCDTASHSCIPAAAIPAAGTPCTSPSGDGTCRDMPELLCCPTDGSNCCDADGDCSIPPPM